MIWLVLWLLLQTASTEKCEEEVPLPSTLPLGKNHEYHLHGHFRANLNESRKISFTVDKESYFRVYTSEHDLVDVDLYLANGTGYYIDFSIELHEQEMIAKILPMGTYTLHMVPFSVDDDDERVRYDCVFIVLELAISAVETALERERAVPDQSQWVQKLPPGFDLSAITSGTTFRYVSAPMGLTPTSPLNAHVPSQYGKPFPASQTIIQKYDLNIVPKPGSNPLFKFHAALGYNFLTGGSLRILLEPAPPASANYTDFVPYCAGGQGQLQSCMHGTNDGMNLNVISETLTAGSYTLWLWDWTAHRLVRPQDLPDPFSFELTIAQIHADETFVSCDAMPLPSDWNAPGLIDETGFMSFREPVLLDLETKKESATFQVPSDFLFRIWTEAHRVDVDFEIKDGAGNVVGRTFQGAREEESFVARLKGGVKYTFTMLYYSSVEEIFCEKIWMEIMIQPLTNQYWLDTCEDFTQNIHPAFPILKGISNTVRMPNQIYFHRWGWAQNHTDVISSVEIVPQQNMRLTALLQSNFLDGITLNLRATQRQTRSPTYTFRGGQRLFVLLSAGSSYTLTIRGGPHQFRADQTGFAPCTSFEFSLDLEPALPAVIRPCAWSPELPTSLEGPSYFGTSHRVHIQDYFRVPAIKTGYVTRVDIPFIVEKRSFLRAYTEPRKWNDVDIDFALFQDGVNLNHTVKEYDEEKLTQILQPNRNYVFRILFYADFVNLNPCTTFNLEFEVAPLFTWTPMPCPGKLPSKEPIWLQSLSTEFKMDEVYQFEQTSKGFVAQIPVRIISSTPVYARVLVSYDFIWSDLSVRIKQGDTNELIVLGDNDFNKNQILGFGLSPGNYTIEIFEPAPLEQEELRRCVNFGFHLGIAPSHEATWADDSDVEDDTDPDCNKLFLPTTLNDIPYLSYYNDWSFHLATQYRVRGMDAENLYFQISKPSVVRVYIPIFTQFDIDLHLWKIVPGTHTKDGQALASSTAFQGEEYLYLSLVPGSYSIEFRYFLKPTGIKCLLFPVEIGVASAGFIESNMALPLSSCPSPTTRLDAFRQNMPVHKDMTRVTGAGPYSLATTFTLTTPSLFSAQLAYTFFTGHMSMILEGNNIQSPFLSAPAKRTIPSYIGQDIEFFDHVLYPGSYSLQLHDPTNYSTSMCSKFSLDYQLFLGYVPETYCDDADSLPSDLYSFRGRSRFYGGPQQDNGNVHISGKHFLIPERRSHNHIKFSIKEPSFVRIWAKFEDAAQNDVDFFLWKDDTMKDLLSASVGLESIESHMTFLYPKDEPYLLDVVVYSRSIKECHFLHFEFVIETNATVVADMVCPTPLPAPLLPSSQVMITQREFNFFGEMFVFTADYIRQNKIARYNYDEIVYPITISLSQNARYEIQTAIGYNFLWSDFSLELYNGTRRLVKSLGDLAVSPDSWDDFRSTLETTVQGPGALTLKIVEKIYSKQIKTGIVGTCEKFSFSLHVEQLGGPTPAQFRVTGVTPPSAVNVDIGAYFRFLIRFSESLGNQARKADMPEWIKQQNVLHLDSNWGSEYPISAQWNGATTILTLTFLPLRAATTYKLALNAPLFTKADGVAAAEYKTEHVYTTSSCDCNGHGTCRTNDTTSPKCVCNSPYAGPDCLSCRPGWHKVGLYCRQNVACKEDTCNGHGTCSDTEGYPICTCDTGFESTGQENGDCSKCHTGYVDYPKCTKQDDSRTLHCEVPLLPTTLDTAAYLEVDGKMHLQGDYYIDVDHFGHDMSFTIEKTSYFRIYTEPHEVDIDLWLFEKKENGQNSVIAYGVSVNQEETFFVKLEPGKYLLLFQFLMFREYSTCPTFNFELAIAPVEEFNKGVTAYRSICGREITPGITMPGSIVPSDRPWSFTKECAVLSLQTEENRAREFYKFDFEVPTVTNHKVLLFELQLGYLFLTGDIGSRLDAQGTNQTVGFGYNGYNQHFLKHRLDAGKYSLILYLPAPLNKDLSPCSPYSISIKTSWQPIDEDIFNCQYSELPNDLDSIAFRGERNHIEVNDKFLIEGYEPDVLTFTVTTPNVIRVQANAPGLLSVSLLKKNGEKWDTIKLVTDGDLFDDSLVAGQTYQVKFLYGWFGGSGVFCPTLNLVLSVIPKGEAALPSQACARPTVPGIPNGRVTLPFFFEGKINPGAPAFQVEDRIFRAVPSLGPVVASWDLTWTENVFLEAAVGSDFMTANLKLSVQSKDHPTIGSHKQHMNHHQINEQLAPGTYTISILQGNRTSISPACIPFSFSLRIRTLANWKATTCSGLVDLPNDFNGMVHSGVRDHIKLFSSKWRVPAGLNNASFVYSHKVYFNVTQESLMRVYVGPHPVDIDIAVYALLNDVNAIARGADLFGEESFITILPIGSYYLRFHFWNLQGRIPACPAFDMEVAIMPTSILPSRKRTCSQGGMKENNWPSIESKFSERNLPYVHRFEGYFQQIEHNQFEKSLKEYTLDFPLQVDLHIEVGFNFLLGNLVTSLTSSSGTTIHGSNRPTKNVLNAQKLAPGTYIFKIYEATDNAERYIGCSDFNIFVLIEKAETSDVSDNVVGVPFPPTLDVIEFLKYSDEIHLQEPRYLMYLGDSLFDHVVPKLTMTLKTPSMVRVSIGNADGIAVSARSGDIPVKDLITQLPAGSHTLTFNVTGSRLARYILTNIQLSVIPVTSVRTYLNEMCDSHQNTPWRPPTILVRPTDGLYHYSDYHAYITPDLLKASHPSVLYTLPFEVQSESVVSAQIMFQHLVGRLTIGLKDQFTSRVGNDDWNMNDLNTLVLPGKFELVINRPAVYPSDLPCGEFGLRISISPRESGADRVDCSDSSIFPWDLNTQTGGSVGMGGPMAGGNLNLWNNKFLMTGSLLAKFTVTQPSLVSIFMHQHTWDSRTTIEILDVATQNVVSSVTDQKNGYQSQSVWQVLSTGTPVDYVLRISYFPNQWADCSTFALGALIQPTQQVTQSLLSQCSKGTKQTLPTRITNNYVSVSSYFTNQDIQAHKLPSSGNFAYEMLFSIVKTSALDVSLQYNPIFSAFRLRLFRIVDGTDRPIAAGEWEAVDSTAKTLTQILDVDLDIEQGSDYKLVISQEPLNYLESTPAYCFPYSFTFQIEDITNSKGFVRYVEPPKGEDFSPKRSIWVEMRFSSAVQKMVNGNPQALSRDQESQAHMAQSVFLQESSSQVKILPIRAVTPDDNPNPDDFSRWLFEFPPENFKYGKSYKLSLVSQRLFTPDKAEIIMTADHTYSMIAANEACGDHGYWNENTKSCVCSFHRTGPSCEDCEKGFVKDVDGNCARPAGCADNTCGCTPSSTPSHCISIGSCQSVAGKPSCECPVNYDGDHCERCAVGYTDYDAGCVKDCNPSCGEYGTCNIKTGTCTCKGNFAGPTCAECAPGFLGTDCTVEVGSSIGKIIGILCAALIAIVLLAVGAWFWRMRSGAYYSSLTNDANDFMEGMNAKNNTEELEQLDSSDSESLSDPPSPPETVSTD